MIFLSGDSPISHHEAYDKYYLTINKKAVFIGELYPHDDETFLQALENLRWKLCLHVEQYDPDIHCLDSFIIWKKLENRKTKQHEILKSNVASEGTIPNGAKEMEIDCGRKRLRQLSSFLSTKKKTWSWS